MSHLKQVKVDNWGIYFLQRLKHFFNRTDFCDLTLQFQNNAQLKVHRLVLSACTEYFELLERTCEMYEDCLIMPDDLQSDVVVPIINFMYTGKLEFHEDLLDKLYQTAQIMNMPVLSKLIDAQRTPSSVIKTKPTHSYSGAKQYSNNFDNYNQAKITPIATTSNHSQKRSYSKAFKSNTSEDYDIVRERKSQKIYETSSDKIYHSPSPIITNPTTTMKQKDVSKEPRPTRYELPEELDEDNIFENSFSNISYTSAPLVVHPETSKQYSSKKKQIFGESSGSRKFINVDSTIDIVQCKRDQDSLFMESNDHDEHNLSDEIEFSGTDNIQIRNVRDSNHLFDQIIENNGPKVTIESRGNKPVHNLDHAKIISEVLKKYPHLVKANKNIKLKILDTPNSSKLKKKAQSIVPQYQEEKIEKKEDVPDFTYESDVINSKQAAKLIAMGVENINGPWICLICGTPGKALHFTSYYKFRRHLVEVHNEKPVPTLCEYCGLKSPKRNYLMHHLYTKHGVKPPPQYNFPSCNICDYVALNEGYLVKHKLTHSESKRFRCNICASVFALSRELLEHIQITGHKYSADRKPDFQCIYCLKSFLRETNLYAHLKAHHKDKAQADDIIENSDDEKQYKYRPGLIKTETNTETSNFETDYEDNAQYQIEERSDGDIQVVSLKMRNPSTPKQKILNPGYTKLKQSNKGKPKSATENYQNNLIDPNEVSPSSSEDVIFIGDTEYVMQGSQLIPKKHQTNLNEEYIITDMLDPENNIEYDNIQNLNSSTMIQQKTNLKKTIQPTNLNQPIQIVVSSDQEYKALMASNHSIIFDEGNKNKTLTVLTTPHNTGLNTNSMNLNNAQSGEMMLIQNDYPMAVSDTIPTSNSNIVVVYSHVNDNKQYQLITPQDISSTFVQSAAVVTQTFDTMTSSASIISPQVMASQTDTAWQENIPQSLNTQTIDVPTCMAEIQPAAILTTEGNGSKMSDDLPEVHIGDKNMPPGLINDTEETIIHQAHAVEEEVSNEELIITNTGEAPMIETVSSDVVIQTVVNEEISDQYEQEIVQPSASNEGLCLESRLEGNEVVITESSTVAMEPVETPTVSDNHHNSECHNPIEITKDTQTINQSNDGVNDQNVIQSNDLKQKIETLASEWSDDDEDKKYSKNDQSSIKSDEVEESIENIRQEMDKQVSQTDNLVVAQPVAISSTPEKISTILNDWDENDSQEENVETNGCETNNSELQVNKADAIIEEQIDPKKNENIKNLVSDWDEDDEEKD